MKNKKIIIIGLITIFFLLLGTLTIGTISKYVYNTPVEKEQIPEKSETFTEEKKKEYDVSLVMVGDALYHSGVYKDGLQSDGTYNFDSQLADVTPIIKNYDLAYYNQETILGGIELGLSNYPRFNSPQEVGDAFLKAGFNLVSLATNHTMDRGEKAILNSVNYWREKENVLTAGSYDSFEDRARSHIGEKNGITYAFLSYTYGTNGIPVPEGKEYLVNLFDKETVKKDIEEVRDKVDIVMVAMHWGVEYTHTPTKEQRDQAQFLADLGVDIIIGSHPHVIEPIEHIGKTVVIYSLGNFISGQDGLMKRIGLLASLDIHKVVENDTTTISIDNVRGDLLYTYHNGGYRKFRVIPFYKLTNDLLPNYKSIQEEYEAILNKNDDTIKVGTRTLEEEASV